MHGASVIFCACIAFHSQHSVVRMPCNETLQTSSLFMAIYGRIEIEFLFFFMQRGRAGFVLAFNHLESQRV